MNNRRHIIIVGDTSVAERTLFKQLDDLTPNWRLTHVAGSGETLAAFEESTVDVVIGGLAERELFRTLEDRHPKTVRFVIAEIAQQKEVMGLASIVHQFVSMPCEARVLRDAVDRACDMEEAMRREKVGRIIGRMDNLPALPDLYLELVERMRDPECSIDQIGEIVARDISMTARILKLVNSAFFGLRRQVSSPNEAVNYLGMDAIKALVLSINAFAKYENCCLGGIALEPLWNHSLMTAGFAKAVASANRGGAKHSEDAFVAGMLHDAGKLVLAANFSADYSEVIASVPEGEDGLLAAEERTFGANHAEIGGHLLALWGLPEAIVDAVTWHHQPQQCANRSFGPLVCVHTANVWAHAEGESEPSLSIDGDYIDALGCTDQLAGWREACLENQAGAA